MLTGTMTGFVVPSSEPSKLVKKPLASGVMTGPPLSERTTQLPPWPAPWTVMLKLAKKNYDHPTF
ncbi:MAG TPA: hypothetical protein VFF65_02615 [Phycisphaerales bacterium]|nr:hypothetical protein [Phycisphaerales bacterium]